MGSLIQSYNELWEIRDKRVEGWPMMASPWPTVALAATYVYLVTIWGPRYMKDRKPYELKMPIQIYNIIQVVLSAYIVYEACVSGWTNHYSWGKFRDRSQSPWGCYECFLFSSMSTR